MEKTLSSSQQMEQIAEKLAIKILPLHEMTFSYIQTIIEKYASQFGKIVTLTSPLLQAATCFLGNILAADSPVANSEQREMIIKILGKIGEIEPQAMVYIAPTLHDSAYKVRGAGALALCSLMPESIAYVRKSLESDEQKVLMAILWGIAKKKIDYEDLHVLVLKTLDMADLKVRELSFNACALFGTKSAQALLDQLAIVLKNEDKKSIYALLSAMMKMPAGSQMNLETIIPLLSTTDDKIRCCALTVVGKFGDKKHLSLLRDHLREQKLEIRLAALEGMSYFDRELVPVLPELLELLSEPPLQSAVLKVIRPIAPYARKNATQIIRLISWDNQELSQEVLLTLAAMGKATIPVMLKLGGKAPAHVRKLIMQALIAVGTPAIPRLVEALAGKCQIERKLASQTLSQFGSEAVPSLVQALYEEDFWIRKVAGQALENIGSESVIPLVNTIRSGNKPARESAYILLKKLKGKVLPFLIPLVKDPETKISQFAIRCIQKISPAHQEAVPELLKMLEQYDDPFILQSVIWGLGKIKFRSPEVIEALQKMSSHDDEQVRQTSTQTLQTFSLR